MLLLKLNHSKIQSLTHTGHSASAQKPTVVIMTVSEKKQDMSIIVESSVGQTESKGSSGWLYLPTTEVVETLHTVNSSFVFSQVASNGR